MKRLCLTTLLGLITMVSHAQFSVSAPHCAYCDVNLTTGEAHKSSCPYYSKPANEEESSSSSSSSPNSSPSSSTSKLDATSSKPITTTSAKRKNFSYECNICKASVMAYNVNEASKEFANNPWFHKPTCKNYKPKAGQRPNAPSTKLKDYTPAPERPMVSEPLIQSPTVKKLPAFSSINETNRRFDEPQPLAGKHEWGEIDEKWANGFLYDNGTGHFDNEFTHFDYELFNHDGSSVILASHQDNGRYVWYVLLKQPDGKYAPAEGGLNNHTNIIADKKYQTVDVHYDGQGTFIVREYEGTDQHVYNSAGKLITSGRNVNVLNTAVNGKQVLLRSMDANHDDVTLYNEDGKALVKGKHITMYDDALIVNNYRSNMSSLCNWRGEPVVLDGIKAFEDIKACDDEGSYYLLKDKSRGYAVVGQGFRRVGNWYNTEEEAHRIWHKYHPQPKISKQ